MALEMVDSKNLMNARQKHLCITIFLSLWTYTIRSSNAANEFMDLDSKEFCDALMHVFGHLLTVDQFTQEPEGN